MVEEVFTTNEVAKILKMSRQTISQLLHRGKLTGIKIGNRWRIRKSDIEDLLNPIDIAPLNPDELDEEDLKDIAEAERDIVEGRVYPWEEVKEELRL